MTAEDFFFSTDSIYIWFDLIYAPAAKSGTPQQEF